MVLGRSGARARGHDGGRAHGREQRKLAHGESSCLERDLRLPGRRCANYASPAARWVWVKTLDLPCRMGHDPAMESLRLLRDCAPVHGVRLEAEAMADAGSPAAAVALLTAAAADLEQDAPGEAGILLAEASAHAFYAHGRERALELARRAVEVAGNGGGAASVIAGAQLGVALQWAGLPVDAQRAWLAAAELPVSNDPHLLGVQAGALLRAGNLNVARERAYAAAARARAAGDEFALRDALTFQAISEIHLGLLHEARSSSIALEQAAGTEATRHATRSSRRPGLGRGAARERRSLPRHCARRPAVTPRRSG